MKKLLFTLVALIHAQFIVAQGSYCNMSGNLMIFSNYDGGQLNINVDVNIPNLKIGIVSYEATQVTLSGAFVNNVTGVVYAGYSGTNNHCSSGTITSINGAPTSATKAIITNPPSTISNPNGYNIIICGYSCSTTTSQGGCNTIDQIEAYMLNYFPSSVLYAHRVQYGCWLGSQSVLAGGNCCASLTNLTLSSLIQDESCQGQCDGKVTAGATGGTPPYTFTLNSGSVFTNLCAGSYVLRVQDNASNIRIDTVVVGSGGPNAPSGDTLQTFCGASQVGNLLANGSNILWYEDDTSSVPLSPSSTLISGAFYYATTTIGSCESVNRLRVRALVNAANVNVTVSKHTLTAFASAVQYQWIDCSNLTQIPNATSKSFTPTSNGSYAVIITENGCSDTSACHAISSVGIDESNTSVGFKLTPNPADDVVTVRFNGSNEPKELKVFGVKGELILSKEITPNSTSIELRLSQGSYVVVLSIGDRHYREQLIVR